jgi:CubicO group peptidase (beta-lactamase class C family)
VRTIQELERAPVAPPHGFRDACLRIETRFSLGFSKPSPGFPFGSPSAFGAPGAGGAFGYADPRTGIAYGYVTMRGGAALAGDPRDVALRAALETACGMR